MATSLYLIAQQKTADRAVLSHGLLTQATARYCYDSKRHLLGRRVVRLPADELEHFRNDMQAVTFVKTEFMNQVRMELGLAPLVVDAG
jgi:hypothetical protein